MKKFQAIAFITLLAVCTLNAQKPPLSHSDYDGWQSISSVLLSPDGKWISYIVNPQQGDGWLYIYNVAGAVSDSVPRGTRPQFSYNSKYLAYQTIPAYNETREAKKKKLKDDKLPKNNLGIKILGTDRNIEVNRVKSFSVPEKNSEWLAYLMEKPIEDKKTSSAEKDSVKAEAKSSNKEPKKPDPKGTELVITNPVSNREHRFTDVVEYVVSREGKTISFLQNFPDTTKIDNFKVNIFNTENESNKVVFEGKGTVKKLTTDNSGKLVSFIYTSDTSKVKIYDLWLSKNAEKALSIADKNSKGFPAGWAVSENGTVSYSDDATRLYFGTARKPIKEPEDTLLEDEKYKLDIWSWDDDLLQPMQKKQLEQELKRTYQAVYHVDKNILYQLADTIMPAVRTSSKGNGDLALGSSDLRYRKLSSWDTRNYSDYFLVNVETGTRRQLFENTYSGVYLSPAGSYILVYDYDTKSWHSMPVAGGELKDISVGIKFPLYDELNDSPSDPRPYGLAGWLDDKRHVLIYDRFDLWMLDLTASEAPVNITSGYGRKNNLRLRYVRLDQDEEFIVKKNLLYLSAFNSDTKEAGFFTLNMNKTSEPVKLLMDKAAFSRDLLKAKEANLICLQRETFANSPNLYVTDMSLKNLRKISSTNPQQKKINWVTAELVEWQSFDKSELQGILYKPENFDPTKKYPMIVYFYERSSDGLYSYFAPAPSASIINRSFAASNGYLVFVPDIPYIIGYPGQSCYNAVMSGTYALLERFPYIDRDRLALDGQSWGGYQIAWLVTQTDLFKCAYSGAPVVNMTSAYGGIRWETGMSRMFQYEQTQSRIGGTLWEKPVHYIENSALFFAPKINTPLLLMHNDADGAVPWYQGIEFITTLRRLNKPAWLLVYNDEAHNLVKRPNRKDISIRKMQFFDHYLKDAPMPYWMKYGIDQTEKGKLDGYELIEN
jgi:dienelactone hydrolase